MKYSGLMILSSMLLLSSCASVSNQGSAVDVRSENDMQISIAADSCDDQSADACNEVQDYGGIKSEYVVRGCKVTIYNNGPIKMVNEKTDQPCNAPIPEEHPFSTRETKTYMQDGCLVTEYSTGDAVMNCSKKK